MEPYIIDQPINQQDQVKVRIADFITLVEYGPHVQIVLQTAKSGFDFTDTIKYYSYKQFITFFDASADKIGAQMFIDLDLLFLDACPFHTGTRVLFILFQTYVV